MTIFLSHLNLTLDYINNDNLLYFFNFIFNNVMKILYSIIIIMSPFIISYSKKADLVRLGGRALTIGAGIVGGIDATLSLNDRVRNKLKSSEPSGGSSSSSSDNNDNNKKKRMRVRILIKKIMILITIQKMKIKNKIIKFKQLFNLYFKHP